MVCYNLIMEIEKAIEIYVNKFVSKETKRAYDSDLKVFFKWLSDTARELSLESLIAYRDMLISAAYAPKTVARKVSSIKNLITYLNSIGLTNVSGLEHVKLQKNSAVNPTQAFTDNEVQAMLDLAKHNRKHCLILAFLFYLGLRRSELVNIKMSHFYDTRSGLVLKVVGKGSKSREIPISGQLKELVQDSLNNTEEPLIGLTQSTIYRIVKHYAKLASVTKRVSPHSCRATVISHLLEKNISPRFVADLVGHSDISTTLLYDKKRDSLDNSPVGLINYK